MAKRKRPNTHYCFTENNDQEGEIWHFFMPIEGNEKDVAKVERLLEDNPDGPYSIEEAEYSQQTINEICISGGESGYMPQYNLVVGFKKLPRNVDWEIDDPFYKAGLIKFNAEDEDLDLDELA